jgi:sec-independent protein translocase protein TatB
LFEGRFSEILVIFVLALIVLGPEKLPRVVSEMGRWVGRARGVARQFREQLEEEVQLEQARKAQRAAPPPPVDPVAAAAEALAASATYGMAQSSAGEPLTAAADSTAAPHVPENGGPNAPLTQPRSAYAAGINATVGRPAQAGGADERSA